MICFTHLTKAREDAIVFSLSEAEWQQLGDLSSLIRSVAGNEPFPKDVIEDLISAYLGILEKSVAFNISPAPLLARKDQLFRRYIALVGKHFREHRDTAFYARHLCLASHYLSPLIQPCGQEGKESLLGGKLKWKSASALCAALAGTKPSERSFSGEKRA